MSLVEQSWNDSSEFLPVDAQPSATLVARLPDGEAWHISIADDSKEATNDNLFVFL